MNFNKEKIKQKGLNSAQNVIMVYSTVIAVHGLYNYGMRIRNYTVLKIEEKKKEKRHLTIVRQKAEEENT